MRFPALVLVLSFGCSSSTTTAVGTGDAGPADAAADTSVAVDSGVDSGAPGYLPAGYAQEPDLSPTPVRKFAQAEQVLDASKDYVAVIETDVGRLVLKLLSVDTPMTCNSFVFLARNRYFDGIAFHRVIEGFMAQTGDPKSIDGKPSTWGSGGPGYLFGLEVKPELNFDGEGVVGMARTSDPNSNGSQFFITFAPATSLNQQYTVFAKVSEGMDVLPKIVRGGDPPPAWPPPTTPTRMSTVRIGSKAR